MTSSCLNQSLRTQTVTYALLLASICFAGAEPSAAPSATPRKVRISFLPPPIDGTISLGIYDGAGKLVRVLQRESDPEEFQVGSDSLSANWDGQNDAGEPLPAGKYHARGYAVGDLEVEGIGFYFNDWISDARPERIEKMCAIAAEGDDVIVSAKVEGAGMETLVCDGRGEIVTTRTEETSASCERSSPPPGEPLASATGKDKTRWVIERAQTDAPSAEVRQYSASGELLRRLRIAAEDPRPFAIAASLDAERIYLLEENGAMQRLRRLTLLATNNGGGESISDWKVDFEKKITAHHDFTVANGEPTAAGGSPPPDKVAIKLKPNPLQKDERTTAELSVGYDADGSFIQTADGLPLQTISETLHLQRVVLAPHGEKSVDVFQDDGAVVEQFRVSGLDVMMAFDCGEFELK